METTPNNSKDKAYDLIHIEDENHPTLGDPDECGSYWTKCLNGESTLDSSNEKLLLKQKLLTKFFRFYLCFHRKAPVILFEGNGNCHL